MVQQAQVVMLDGGLGEFLLGHEVHADVVVLHQRPAQEPGDDGDRDADGAAYTAKPTRVPV